MPLHAGHRLHDRDHATRTPARCRYPPGRPDRKIVVKAATEQAAFARRSWSSAATAKKGIRTALEDMTVGRRRCMYCGDNEGTDIDHYEPLAKNPRRTFSWPNHLLACSVCNSHKKRDRFPLDAAGAPLLLDPTVDSPLDHLLLTLAIGEYVPLSERGRMTIEVCDLNRPLLTRGRMQARRVVVYALRTWMTATATAQSQLCADAVATVVEQPMADVVIAMIHQAGTPLADQIFSDCPDILPALRSRDFLEALTSHSFTP